MCEKLETNTSHLMFEFPARCHFGLYYVTRLLLLLSNNGSFVHRFPKGMEEIIVATVKHHNIQNGGTQKIQISKELIFVPNTRNAFLSFISTNFKLK